jgi:hypothetical protein
MHLFRSHQFAAVAVDEAIELITRSWLSEHSRGKNKEETWLNNVVETHISLQCKTGGRVAVQATVLTRNPYKSLTEVAVIEPMPDGTYKISTSRD